MIFGISFSEKDNKPKTLSEALENLKKTSQHPKKEEAILGSLKEVLDTIQSSKNTTKDELDKIKNTFMELGLLDELLHLPKIQKIIIEWLSKNIYEHTELAILLNNLFETYKMSSIDMKNPKMLEAMQKTLIKILRTPWDDYKISDTYQQIESLKNKFPLDQLIIDDSLEIQDALKEFIKGSFFSGSLDQACNTIELMKIKESITKNPQIQESIEHGISITKKHQNATSYEDSQLKYEKSINRAQHYLDNKDTL